MGRTVRFSFMALVYAFLYLPIIVLIVNSFNANKFGMKWGGFTTKWYETLVNNDSLMQAAWHSLNVAVFSATAATIIGSLTAVALFRYSFKGKGAVNGMLFVVMMSPDIVMAISLLALFLVLGAQLGFFTLLIAHITFCLPFVVVTVYSRLNGFDVKMLEAAKVLPLKIYSMVKVGISPEVNALATVMLIVSLVLVVISQLLAREKVK
ncbi:spermidine/putrescine ABC transporter permease PotC [Vibrio rotiferianus]